MQDTTYAHVTRWTEYRTPSGRWSKVRHDETEEDFKPHNLSFFFQDKFPGERRQYGYFREGYLPCRVMVPGPDRDVRRVYLFSYYTGPREVVHYTYED